MHLYAPACLTCLLAFTRYSQNVFIVIYVVQQQLIFVFDFLFEKYLLGIKQSLAVANRHLIHTMEDS